MKISFKNIKGLIALSICCLFSVIATSLYAQNTAEGWFDRGLQETNFNHKIACYDKAIQLNPKMEQAYQNRGYCKLQQYRYEEAISDFNKVIELDPNWAAPYRERGACKYNLKHFNEAVADFSSGIKLYADKIDAGLHSENNPLSSEKINQLQDYLADLYFIRSKAKQQLGQEKAAQEDFKQCQFLITIRHHIIRN